MTDASNTRFCHNCYHPLEQKDDYCSNCGQEYTTGKVSFFSVVREFIDNFIALDSKVLRSLPLLFFKPGQLTIEFFKGKHKRYVSPIRLFLFSTVVFFALLTFQTGGFSNLDKEFEQGTKQRVDRKKRHNAMVADIDSTVSAVKKKIPDQGLRNELDSAFADFQPMTKRDTMPVVNITKVGEDNADYHIDFEDLFSLSADEIIEKYEMNPRNKWERMILRKIIRVQQEGGSFVSYLFSRLSWLIFILVPFFALVMKILYYFNNRYIVEHLVFGLHFHSFLAIAGIFMIYLIPLKVALWTPLTCLGLCLYLFVAMRRYYQQGFWKTLFKYSLLCFSFMFVVIFASLLLIFISAAMF